MFKILADKIVTLIGKINWNFLKRFFYGKHYELTVEELSTIRELLKNDYYIILTRSNNRLSTYAINFSHWWLTGEWGYYAHSVMNLEDEVHDDSDFRLMEATNKHGVAYVDFESAFACDSVALLKPKNMSLSDWTHALDNLKSHHGKKYDTLYNLLDDSKMSCVELTRSALMAVPDYQTKFANFEEMIYKAKNLDPHMFYRCEDFEVVYEVRH